MTVSEWIEQYQELGIRFPTMQKALEMFLESNGKLIVETGTIRMKDDWGAGMSTYIFGSYVKEFGGHLFTDDIDAISINLCKEITKDFAEHITYIVNDSLAFLTIFNQTIDLLYLDSMDCPEYDAPDSPNLLTSQVHQLNEMTIALPKMNSNGIVLLDDNDFSNGGKTKLTKTFLAEHGWKEVLSNRQSLWSKI